MPDSDLVAIGVLPAVEKAHYPSRETNKFVRRATMFGLTQIQIASLLEISVDVLRNHYPSQLKATEQANFNVAKTIYQKAIKGDMTAAIFWMRARAGWRDREQQQILQITENRVAPTDARAVEQGILAALSQVRPAPAITKQRESFVDDSR